MPRPKSTRKTTRLTVSLDVEAYAALLEIAHREDVSVAWVVRRAVNELVGKSKAANDLVSPVPIGSGKRTEGTR